MPINGPVGIALRYFETPIPGALSLDKPRRRNRSVLDPGNKINAVQFSRCDLPYTVFLLARHVAWHCQQDRPIVFAILQSEERRFREEYCQ
jgi:hypothetical protein